jgi:hypothetical protein
MKECLPVLANFLLTFTAGSRSFEPDRHTRILRLPPMGPCAGDARLTCEESERGV